MGRGFNPAAKEHNEHRDDFFAVFVFCCGQIFSCGSRISRFSPTGDRSYQGSGKMNGRPATKIQCVASRPMPGNIPDKL
jgi:hypothetical protein